MRSWRLSTYILRETLAPFALGLGVLLAVLLLGRFLRLVEMVISKGVPAGEIVKLFLYLIPSFLTLCLPLAFLMGVILAYGRLSADGEIIAMKSTGFSVINLMKPVLWLALPVSILTASMSLYFQPQGYHAFRNQIFSILNDRAHVALKERVFIDQFADLTLYANELAERSGVMQGVFIQDRRQTDTPSYIWAQRGRILSDAATRSLSLLLEKGSIHRTPAGVFSPTYQTVGFDRYEINLNMDETQEAEAGRRIKDKELSTPELSRRIDESESQQQRQRLQAAYHKRLALPLAPLIFALLGGPLGMTSNRSGKGGGFALALMVFLGYYLLLSFGETLGAEGVLPPALSVWTPNVLLLGLGIIFMRRASLERPIPRLGLPKFLSRLKHRKGAGR